MLVGRQKVVVGQLCLNFIFSTLMQPAVGRFLEFLLPLFYDCVAFNKLPFYYVVATEFISRDYVV